jgi:RNA polymerase sigma-70 factor (ECF subfamily)
VAASEQLTVREAREGNPDAWDQLLRRYQLPLYVYVHELVSDEQASLDIVQECFITAVRHIHTLREDARFGSWLFGIAHQKCLQLWRRRKAKPLLADELPNDLVDDQDDPAEWLLHQEQQEEFMNLLNQLPAPQRSVLVLFFLEEFSMAEIADITGTAIGTIKSRLHYAKKALKQLLTAHQP